MADLGQGHSPEYPLPQGLVHGSASLQQALDVLSSYRRVRLDLSLHLIDLQNNRPAGYLLESILRSIVLMTGLLLSITLEAS